jgi:thiamine biosynthesis lipoprotein
MAIPLPACAPAPRRIAIPHAISGPPPALGAQLAILAGETMGTRWRALACTGPGPHGALRRALQSELDLVVAQMSTWDEASDLARFNRAAPGSRHALPDAFAHVLACGLEVARASGGAFDPTVGALVDAWGFGPAPRERAEPPTAAAVAAAQARGGWRRLAFDGGVACQPGGLALDLSGIAKGYGVDCVARRLEALGVSSYLVEVGGELRGAGAKPDGRPWFVALESPAADAGLPEHFVALHGLSVATSGDYRRFFDHAGARYGHTLDPRTGRPIAHGLASVSVLHADCMRADAWATALTVLGPDDGLAAARAHGLAARFVVRAGDGFVERLSPAYEALLR